MESKTVLSPMGSPIRTSFFDDNKDTTLFFSPGTRKSLWINQNAFSKLVDFYKLYVSPTLLFEGTLFRKNQKTGKMKPKLMQLYKDRLIQLKIKTQEVKEIMLLRNTKAEFMEQFQEEGAQYNYCICLTSNKTMEVFFLQAQQDYFKWKQNFSACCILSYFSKAYTNVKVIGKGNFAKVLLAKRNNDSQEFAVKVFDKASIMNQKGSSRSKTGLINEIQIMRLLSHPNIIKLYEVYEGEHHIYLVLELLKGGELFDRIISAGHYSEDQACQVMKQLLSALNYLHQMGIMHRDIKPENLILKDENERLVLKLADFGLAEFASKGELIFKRCGTPGYVAPEILNDLKYDTTVDAFSAGVIFYILLTGCSVFNGKNHDEIIMKNKNCFINWSFEKINIKLSNNALSLLKCLLEKDPTKRITISNALQHPWMHYFQQKEKQELEESQDCEEDDLNDNTPFSPCNILSAQENMKIFQEERFNVSKIKPQDIVCNSPLITGRQDTVKTDNNGEMFSPNAGVTPQNSAFKQENLHKRALLKSMVSNGIGQLLPRQFQGPGQRKIEEPVDADEEQARPKQVSGIKNRLKTLETKNNEIEQLKQQFGKMQQNN